MAGRKRKDGSANNNLKDPQKYALLSWIAEGCNNDEIRNRAMNFTHEDENGVTPMPFQLSPQHIYAYRKNSQEDIETIRKEREFEALRTGLALKSNRIAKLDELANILLMDLFQKKKTWLSDAKTVAQEYFEFERFNGEEIAQFRGLLDDIAKETGGRIVRTDITSGEKPIKGYAIVDPNTWDKKTKEQNENNGK